MSLSLIAVWWILCKKDAYKLQDEIANIARVAGFIDGSSALEEVIDSEGFADLGQQTIERK